MIKQKCNLIALAIYHDEDFGEEVAMLYSPISSYYFPIPTRHILETTKHSGHVFVTELQHAYFIPSIDVTRKINEWRKRK